MTQKRINRSEFIFDVQMLTEGYYYMFFLGSKSSTGSDALLYSAFSVLLRFFTMFFERTWCILIAPCISGNIFFLIKGV